MATNKQPKTTRLSSDVTAPQPTDAGDAPADTFDEKERATSVRPDKAAAAAAGHSTVNAVVPGEPIEDEVPVSQGRTETYTVFDNANKPVQVTRDLDTGETTVTEGVEGQAAGTFSTMSINTEGEESDLFDPAEHTVEAVIEYLNGLDDTDQEAYKAEVQRVYEAEQSGKARTTILDVIDQLTGSTE